MFDICPLFRYNIIIMVVVCRNSNFYYCFDAKSSIWLQIFKENLTKPIAMIVVQN